MGPSLQIKTTQEESSTRLSRAKTVRLESEPVPEKTFEVELMVYSLERNVVGTTELIIPFRILLKDILVANSDTTFDVKNHVDLGKITRNMKRNSNRKASITITDNKITSYMMSK